MGTIVLLEFGLDNYVNSVLGRDNRKNMYPIYELDVEQAANILATQENYLNDIKAREIKPAKLSETISAFSNAAGGDVYIGIGEDKKANIRTWHGFDDPEQANAGGMRAVGEEALVLGAGLKVPGGDTASAAGDPGSSPDRYLAGDQPGSDRTGI